LNIFKEVIMRWTKPLLFVALLTVFCSGCATHLDYYSYGNTRKFLDSGAPEITKNICVAFVFIPDTVMAPIASYRDTAEHAPEGKGGHVYLSYLGFRTLMQSDLKPVYKWVGGTVDCIFDTCWFILFTGLADTLYAVQN
jgi:hypothetical protein